MEKKLEGILSQFKHGKELYKCDALFHRIVYCMALGSINEKEGLNIALKSLDEVCSKCNEYHENFYMPERFTSISNTYHAIEKVVRYKIMFEEQLRVYVQSVYTQGNLLPEGAKYWGGKGKV